MASGTLYFSTTAYSAEYAVDYSYDGSTFYIESVQVKLAQYVSVWWGFDLTVKINNTTIYSGSNNHFIDSFDWYDLGISGSGSVTDTVTVTLVGSAIHNNMQFNVASPTSKTVSTGSGGSSGSGDSSGSTAASRFLYITQGEGIEDLTVNRTWSDNGYTGQVLNGASVWYGTDVFEISVKASEGYTLNYFTLNGVKVPFNSTNIKKTSDGRYTLASDDNASIVASASIKEYKLSATAGTGSYITVTRKASKKSGAQLGVLSNGATLYYLDTIEVSVGVEAGYEIVDTVVSGCTENDDGTFTVTGNTSVTVSTGLMGLVYIDNGTSFVPCLIYIDNGSSWDQCIPYVDNGTGWDLCS